MKIFAHRINHADDLAKLPERFGVEMDLRSNGKELIIHHDPFQDGERFIDWLKVYRHNGIILNVKEEGLESAIIDLMKSHQIEDYWFLDQSFPFLIKTSKQGESRCAVRFSEFESIDTVLSLKGMVNWVWVDTFTHLSLTKNDELLLHKAGFKLCLVSDELQGRSKENIVATIKKVQEEDIDFDAVCTKQPILWEQAFNANG